MEKVDSERKVTLTFEEVEDLIQTWRDAADRLFNDAGIKLLDTAQRDHVAEAKGIAHEARVYASCASDLETLLDQSVRYPPAVGEKPQ